MAGAGYKLFNTGDVLTAAQVNTYLNEQTVMVFANAAARTSALTSVLAEGMVSYLQDTNAVEVYNGSAWVGVSGAGDVTEVQAGTGISVASGTGPIPVVTNTMATAIDAKADLIVGTGADTFARLAVGTNNFVLTAASGETTGLKWQGFSGVRLTKSAAQTIANSTNTVITFDTETYDTDSYHSTVTNTSRITIPSGKTGYYNVIASCIWAYNSGSYRNLHIYKNGSNLTHILTGDPGTTYPNVNMLIVDALYLTAGDYIEMNVYQATGGNLDIQSNAQYQSGTRFEAYYLGA